VAGDPYRITYQQGTTAIEAPLRYRFDSGEYTGLAFSAGRFYPIWSDNSNSTGDNPNGVDSALDLYTAAGTVFHVPDAPGIVNGAAGDPSSANAGTDGVLLFPLSQLLQASLLLDDGTLVPNPLPTTEAPQLLDGPAQPVPMEFQATSTTGAASLVEVPWGVLPEQAPSPEALVRFFQALADGLADVNNLKDPLS
jgi:hypothetical protein